MSNYWRHKDCKNSCFVFLKYYVYCSDPIDHNELV